MHSKVLLFSLVVLLFAGTFYLKNALRSRKTDAGERAAGSTAEPQAPCAYKRIVSLSPSVTEILFALGLGDKVKGVTEFCDFPPEAMAIPKIGGYFDINFEAIVALEPDLVVLLGEHHDTRRGLQEMGLKTVSVNHKTIDGILESLVTLGSACGAADKGRALAAELRRRVDRVCSKTQGLPRPRTLISVDHPMGTGSLTEVYIAGHEAFYNAMLEWAGGENAYTNETIKFPMVTVEGILEMNPEVIIDVAADLENRAWTEEAMLAEWNTLKEVKAVASLRVHIFTDDFVVIPGPRFILTLEKMARTLHPELDWSEP
ncbi:MAG: helical backbone metal receptor [Planctomycetota bacterium]